MIKKKKKQQSTWSDVFKAMLFVKINNIFAYHDWDIDSTDNYLDEWGRKKANAIYALLYIIIDIIGIYILSITGVNTPNAIQAGNILYTIAVITGIIALYIFVKNMLYKRK